MIDKLPTIQPDNDFVEKLWNEINIKKPEQIFFWTKFSNALFMGAILILMLSSLVSFYLLNSQNANKLESIEIELTRLSEDEINRPDNLLLIYDLNNSGSEILTNYEIKDEKLLFKLKPGNYKLIFASTKYKKIVVSNLVISNS